MLRSDAHIFYTPSNDPLTLEITSKVGSLFGKALHEQAAQVCSALAVTTGHLLIEDFGALPFVIAARIEAALKQALPTLRGEALPAMEPFCAHPSQRDRLRRSRLYIPGNQPKLMLNAGIHQPDGIILDLEDSVPPPEKDAARFIVRNALRSINFFGAERMVRINQGARGLADLEFIVSHNVHLILIPKVETAQQVHAVDAKIQSLCPRPEPIFLMPIIESAAGIMNAQEIATASPNIVALTIGIEDYTADIGAHKTDEGKESLFARNVILNAARAAGIQPIDSVFSDIDDIDGLIKSALDAKALGFEGKGCIHPRQIRPIHQAFAPTAEEIAWAAKVVEASENAAKQGLGAVTLGSKMIDPPVVKRAQQLIARLKKNREGSSDD